MNTSRPIKRKLTLDGEFESKIENNLPTQLTFKIQKTLCNPIDRILYRLELRLLILYRELINEHDKPNR